MQSTRSAEDEIKRLVSPATPNCSTSKLSGYLGHLAKTFVSVLGWLTVWRGYQRRSPCGTGCLSHDDAPKLA